MTRTQVYLGSEEEELLARAARISGASKSELIRRAVRKAYGDKTTQERLTLLRAGRGLWRDRDFTGAEYVDAIRHDLNDRLRHLGLE